jgi:hypothetical protein
MAFKMKGSYHYGKNPLKQKQLKKVVKELNNASKMHKAQANTIEDYMKSSPLQKQGCNCWSGYSRVPGTKPCAPGSCKKSSPSKQTNKRTKGKDRHFRKPEEGAGMTKAGVESYKKQNPGSNLQTAVTGKVKPGSKDAGRRKSFCARSRGWTGERGKAARARWKC